MHYLKYILVIWVFLVGVSAQSFSVNQKPLFLNCAQCLPLNQEMLVETVFFDKGTSVSPLVRGFSFPMISSLADHDTSVKTVKFMVKAAFISDYNVSIFNKKNLSSKSSVEHLLDQSISVTHFSSSKMNFVLEKSIPFYGEVFSQNSIYSFPFNIENLRYQKIIEVFQNYMDIKYVPSMFLYYESYNWGDIFYKHRMLTAFYELADGRTLVVLFSLGEIHSDFLEWFSDFKKDFLQSKIQNQLLKLTTLGDIY